MKKLLLTLFALAGMASAVVASGPVSLPGFKKRVPIQRHVENRQMPTVAVQPVKLVTPPKAAMREAPAGMEYVDRLLKEDITLGSWVSSMSFEYDEYGFPKKTTSTSGDYTTYEYTWQVPGKIWASKKVSVYDAYGNLSNMSTDIQRTFYPDGAVKTSTVRNENNGSFAIYEYDNDGNLIKQTENSYTGEFHITSYIYFPLLDSWLESIENPWEKRIVTLDGNNGYIIENWKTENNVWRKTSEEGNWYDYAGNPIGSMYLWYETDGVQGYGEKIVVEESDNGISEIYYRLDEEDGNVVLSGGNVVWLPSSKTVYSRNYNDPWVYDAGEVRTKEMYDYEDNQWVISYKRTYTWVKDNVVKEVSEDYEYEEDSYTSYCQVLEDGTLNSDFYYDEATGNYAIYEYDGEYDYYTYYDAAGNVISKFRENENRYGAPTYERWVNGAWSKCTGTVTIYDGDDKYVVTFDEQGRVVREEEYENGLLEGYSEYTYTDKGHVTKYYEPVSGGGQVYLAYEESYTTEGNIVTYIDLTYSEDGSIEYAYKSVNDTENRISYNYQLSDGEWVLNGAYVEPVEEILADGTMIRIERVLDADGNIINSSKTVDLETPDRRLSERYDWNVERGDWDGVWKHEEVKIDKEPFAVVWPVNPEIFEDEYFFPVEDEEEPFDMDWYQIQWQWDSYNNTWVRFNYAPEYTYPDEYTQVVKNKSMDGESVETIRVDSERRMIEMSTSSTWIWDGQTSTSQHLWTYDDKGRVVSDIEHRVDGDTWTYYYTYGPIEVISGVEDVISGATAKVTVYNLQGICVLRDATPDAVAALPRGLYIINGKKVAIR